MSKATPNRVTPPTYIREVQTELKKVSWPSQEATVQMTALVIGVSAVIALYLGALDYIFTQLISALI